MPKNTTEMTRLGLEPGPLDPESSALTTRPPCLPLLVLLGLQKTIIQEIVIKSVFEWLSLDVKVNDLVHDVGTSCTWSYVVFAG